MNRSVRFRVAALWAAMLLVLTWGEDAFALHACPHHGMVAQAGAHGAGMGGGHASPHDRRSPSPEHQGCTCIGCCHAGSGAPLPAANTLAVRADAAHVAAAPAWRGATALPSSPSFLLPYSTAPPPAA